MPDFLAAAEREQLHREFAAIVDPQANRLDTYQRAAERMSERAESAVGLAASIESARVVRSVSTGVSSVIFHVGVDRKRTGVWRSRTTPHPDTPIPGFQIKADEPTASDSDIGYALFYRVCWVVLALALMVWGGVVGASLAGAALVGPITATAGTIGLIGLSLTLAVAGRRTRNQRDD